MDLEQSPFAINSSKVHRQRTGSGIRVEESENKLRRQRSVKQQKSQKENQSNPPELYVASYGLGFKSALSALALGAMLILVLAAVSEWPSADADLTFQIVAVPAIVLETWFLLGLWRRRIVFREDGMVISSSFKTAWKSYNEVRDIRQTADKLEVRFVDGSTTSIDLHMANLISVAVLLDMKVPKK